MSAPPVKRTTVAASLDPLNNNATIGKIISIVVKVFRHLSNQCDVFGNTYATKASGDIITNSVINACRDTRINITNNIAESAENKIGINSASELKLNPAAPMPPIIAPPDRTIAVFSNHSDSPFSSGSVDTATSRADSISPLTVLPAMLDMSTAIVHNQNDEFTNIAATTSRGTIRLRL